jgi:hypothetical protein
MAKERRKLSVVIEVEHKDFFGFYTLEVLINQKSYTYYLNSEFALRKVKSLLYRHKAGRALKVLKLFNIKEEHASI